MKLLNCRSTKFLLSITLLTETLTSSCDKSNPNRAPLRSERWVVSTFAGSLNAGSTDSIGALAKFRNPKGITIDGTGNLYVADAGNNTIRKITPSGTVSTLAGLAGAAGPTDGKGTLARFNNPSGITIDAGGNFLYVADAGNNRIRLIDLLTTPGLVSTKTTNGATDLIKPTGITMDQSAIYVADAGNNRIRKIPITGTTTATTVAGIAYAGTPTFKDTIGTSARFFFPTGLVVDALGTTFYVADSGNHRIRKVAPAGTTVNVTTLAGSSASFADGGLTSATFNGPYGITRAGSVLYIADWNNNRIRHISLDQTPQQVKTFSGNGSGNTFSDGDATYNATFKNPAGIVMDKEGNFYVTDAGNNCIRKITYVKR